MTLLGWLGRTTSIQTNKYIHKYILTYIHVLIFAFSVHLQKKKKKKKVVNYWDVMLFILKWILIHWLSNIQFHDEIRTFPYIFVSLSNRKNFVVTKNEFELAMANGPSGSSHWSSTVPTILNIHKNLIFLLSFILWTCHCLHGETSHGETRNEPAHDKNYKKCDPLSLIRVFALR